jgi:hypothetical protein
VFRNEIIARTFSHHFDFIVGAVKHPAFGQVSSRDMAFTEQNWGKSTQSYLTTIKNLREGSFAKIVAMAQLYACSQNGDDAEPEDEVDECAQLMDISDDECKSRYVYCANYLLLHPQNLILAYADAVAASRLGLHQFCGNALVPGHFIGPCSISHSRSFANILSPRVYPADLAPQYPSCPLLLLFWIQYV